MTVETRQVSSVTAKAPPARPSDLRGLRGIATLLIISATMADENLLMAVGVILLTLTHLIVPSRRRGVGWAGGTRRGEIEGAKGGRATWGGDKEGRGTWGGDKEGRGTWGGDKEGRGTWGGDKEGRGTWGGEAWGRGAGVVSGAGVVVGVVLLGSFLFGSPLGVHPATTRTTTSALVLVAGLTAFVLVPPLTIPWQLPALHLTARPLTYPTYLTYLGDRSFSIFLWQWAAGLPVTPEPHWAASLIALIPAWLSHRYLDRSGTTKPTAALTIAVLAILAAAPAVALPRLMPELTTYRADELTPTFATHKGCLIEAQAYRPDDIERCTVRVPHAKGWILLAGDDHTASFSTAVVRAANDLGYDIVSLQGQGCAFTRRACPQLNSDLLERVHAHPPRLVVTTATDRATMTELHASGVPNLIVKDVRHQGAGGPACRGGLLTFTCGTAVINGHLGYADATHLNGIGSAALTSELTEEIRESMSTSLATE